MTRFGLAALALALGAAGCAGRYYERPPLERTAAGLAIQETRQRGATRVLTGTATDAVTKSAEGRTVDLESTLELFVLPGALVGAPAPPSSAAESAESARAGEALDAMRLEQRSTDQLAADLAKLERIVAGFADHAQASEEAVRLWAATPADAARDEATSFARAVATAAELEETILREVASLEGPLFSAEGLDRDFERLEDAAVAFEVYVERVEERLAELASAAGHAARIEAFLLRSEGEDRVVNVHVENYDELDRGQVVRRDRRGIFMTPEERARFERLSGETRRLAITFEDLRRRQASLAAYIAATASTALAPLGELAAAIDEVATELGGRAWDARVDATRSALGTFVDAAGDALDASAEELLEELEGELGAAAGDGPMSKLLRAATLVRDLQRRMRGVTPADAAELVLDVAALARDVNEALRGVPAAGASLAENLAGIGEGLADAASPLGDVWESSALRAELDGWKRLAEQLTRIAQSVQALAPWSAAAPTLAIDARAPEVLDVPLDAAPPGLIRLREVPAVEGDTLRLRFTHLAPDGFERATTSDLELGYVGWHARFDPALVLAAPEGGGDGAEVRFAPSLAWLWTYTPEDDDSGRVASFLRALSPGLGPHAVFLPFDDDSALEIGLGLTLSVANGMLLGGFGYDLHRDDDPLYWFVGTSLIASLQKLQDL